MDPVFLVVAAVAIAVPTLIVHLIEWHLYITTRNERDLLRERLDAVIVDRDGWRNVGERALMVAQMGKRVSVRAARLASDRSRS